ncbi:MAG: DNA translocase FtsK 4TM domain-containing protein, partial [Chloroflexi bacterium]|nr:DNA translocase FtsK 4TM domain-containing protein [Chloroflexota bacterium]
MSDKLSDDKERPRSSIFGSRSDDKREEERGPEEHPSPFGGRPIGSIFGRPTMTSVFGRPTPMPPRPITSTSSTLKPPESKLTGGAFGAPAAEAPKVEDAKPAASPKPESPGAAPKPEEKKAGGLFSFLRKPAAPPKPESPSAAPKPEEKKAGGFLSALRNPPTSPKLESPSAAPKPEEKKAGGFLSALRKPADPLKPTPPAETPKIGTGKPAEKPHSGILSSAKPAEQKPAESGRKRSFWRLFKGSSAPTSETGALLKTTTPPDPKRSGSSVPGAPPARGEKQARPLEGQTHVTVKNVGLSLDQKLDIIGWLLIATGIVMIFGLIQPDEGTFTKAIVDIFGALFGYGRYLIPIPCLAVGIWLFVRYFKENPFLALNAQQMTGAALLFLSIVTWLHTIELIDKVVYDWDELIAVSARAVDQMQGGGWVGDRLYMILIRLTGEFGVPVVLTITTLVGALWFFELSLAEIAIYIKSVFQILGARLRRIRESWRAWRHAAAMRRAARAAARAELRAQREAAKLAAQAQKQPQPAARLPASATLATAEMLSRQPLSAPIGAEGQPSDRKVAFRAPVVVPAAAVSEPPITDEDTAPPVPAIAKPSPLGAHSAATKKRSTAQPSPFSAPIGAAPAEPSKPAAEAPPEHKTTGVFSSPFGKTAQPEPAASAQAAPAEPVPSEPPKPAESAKRATFGPIFGSKPRSEPSTA